MKNDDEYFDTEVEHQFTKMEYETDFRHMWISDKIITLENSKEKLYDVHDSTV